MSSVRDLGVDGSVDGWWHAAACTMVYYMFRRWLSSLIAAPEKQTNVKQPAAISGPASARAIGAWTLFTGQSLHPGTWLSTHEASAVGTSLFVRRSLKVAVWAIVVATVVHSLGALSAFYMDRIVVKPANDTVSAENTSARPVPFPPLVAVLAPTLSAVPVGITNPSSDIPTIEELMHRHRMQTVPTWSHPQYWEMSDDWRTILIITCLVFGVYSYGLYCSSNIESLSRFYMAQNLYHRLARTGGLTKHQAIVAVLQS